MKTVYRKGLHRFCLFLSFSTFLLVIAGGMVTSTDSGLAVPDWPLSYGQLMPPMVGGIFYEHGHRMIATFVGFLTTVMAVWMWRHEPRKWLRILGLSALGMVIVQGVLGGITVLFLLPVPVSVAHATLAQSFFALTVFISLATSRWWCEHEPGPPLDYASLRPLGVAAFVAVFVQLLLGALMRHTDAGLAVPDFPLAYGSVWPSVGEEDIRVINSERIGIDLLPVTGMQVTIHMLHRLWALVVGGLVFFLAFRTYRRASVPLREPVLLLILLTLFQFVLGALTVWTGKNAAVSTAHVATGSLIFATCSVITAVLYRGGIPGPKPAMTPEFAGERVTV